MKLKLRTKGKSRFLTPDETEEVIAQITDNAQEDLKARAQQTTQFQQLQAAITQTVSSTLTVGSALVSTTLAVAVVTIVIEVTLDPTLPTPVELAVDTVVDTVIEIIRDPLAVPPPAPDVPTPPSLIALPPGPGAGAGGAPILPFFVQPSFEITSPPLPLSTTVGALDHHIRSIMCNR